jgi:DeoR/GlpR family transcriptional regulator of sugar metabolism
MEKIRTSSRLRRILDLLAARPEVSVADLAARFQVTPMTVRRDLAALEKQGRVTRTHGGAILAAPAVARFAFRERQQTHLPEKRAIARAAATQVMSGTTVILDTGTTTLEVAEALAGIPGLRVLTSSLAIASALFAHEEMELVLLGGTVSRGSPDLCGPLTEQNLAAFRADVAFIGADGVDRHGLYTRSQAIASVSRAMLAGAARTILVADSSKFGRNAFVRFADWKKVDGVIVDDGLAAGVRRWLRKAVKDVVQVTVSG